MPVPGVKVKVKTRITRDFPDIRVHVGDAEPVIVPLPVPAIDMSKWWLTDASTGWLNDLGEAWTTD